MRTFTLAYCTNLWNHYQASLCEALNEKMSNGAFRMVVCEELPAERLKLGWQVEPPVCDWLIGPPKSNRDRTRIEESVLDADVAVLGACPGEILEKRCKSGKLTFVMSERLWKKPFYKWRMLNPRFASGVRRLQNLVNRDSVHYLAMGHFAAADARVVHAYGDRMWSWPYFASIPEDRPEEREGEIVHVLWAGRMIEWKRVDWIIEAASQLSAHPALGRIELIGDGPDRETLKRLAKRRGLEHRVVFRDPVPPEEVRKAMRHADVFVLASDRREGWGVVVNEAMAEGCVVLANADAGSARELIEDGVNGVLFDGKSATSLARKLARILGAAEERRAMSSRAWESVRTLWHPKVGASRLLELSGALLNGTTAPTYAAGPCRRLEVYRG